MYIYKFTTDNPRKPWLVGLNTDNGFSVLCYCVRKIPPSAYASGLTGAVQCPNSTKEFLP
jgi:hypothetical protein